MIKKLSVSVVVSAYNEEKKIADCLESVAWAEEIIVVDNESQDKTASIAKKYGATVLSRPNNLMLNVNKNYGFAKAKNKWVLSLDADERVTPELVEEIRSLLSLPEADLADGYWMPRRNIIFGKWIKYTGWYPDEVLRLFKSEKGRFEEKHVHEMIKIEGEEKHLKSDLIHLNYETIAQFLHKTTVIYAPNEASELLRKGYKFRLSDAFSFPINEFLSRYFARQGYKDGFHGLMLSMLMAAYHLIVFAYIWEKKEFRDPEEKDILHSTERGIVSGYRDFKYWIYEEKIRNSKNRLQKLVYKVIRKI